jgi:hypothetical protein
MPENFVETSDSSGRTVVEMNDHALGLLSILALICAFPVVFLAGYRLQMLLFALPAFAVFALLYLLTRKRVRLVIDPDRRELILGRRVIRLDQIVRAELAVQRGARASGPGGGPVLFNRVELVLRSGERLPTSSGFGQFPVDDCHRLVELINEAAGVR